MPTVYLHLGLHSTATTTIQDSLFGASEVLARAGVLYPDLGWRNHSSPIRALFADPGRLRGRVIGQGTASGVFLKRLREDATEASTQRTTRTLKAAIEDGGYRRIVLSGEGVSGLTATEFAALRDFFAELGGTVVVVVYLRHPEAVASAMTGFRVEMGELFPDSPKQAPAPQFRALLEPVLEAFGRERILFRPFPPGPGDAADPVTDFLETIGCPELDDSVPRITRNRSRSDASLRILERYNQLVPKWTDPDRTRRNPERSGDTGIELWLGSIKGPPFRFGYSFLQAVSTLNQADRAWIENVAGFEIPRDPKLDLPDPVYTDPACYEEPAARLRELLHARARGDGERARGAARAIIRAAPPDCRIDGPLRRMAES